MSTNTINTSCPPCTPLSLLPLFFRQLDIAISWIKGVLKHPLMANPIGLPCSYGIVEERGSESFVTIEVIIIITIIMPEFS
jgi:hypothetical protein